MAPAAPFPRRLLLSLLLGVLVVAVVAAADVESSAGGGGGRRHSPRRTRYSRVFSFGDSLTDTGNAAILPATAGGPFTRPPYGMTFYHHPTGRASDGRLVIDFLVKALGLPEPTPYLAGKTAADFRRGVNFAVGGATALDPAFLKSRGMTSSVPVSLSNETRWFQDVLQLLGASAHEKHTIAASSIFYFGEIGFNDYSFALSAGNGTVDVAASLVPDIIAVIRSAVTAVIAAGARTVVVAGMIPIGCEPEMLALFPGGAGNYYDPASGCITRFNDLAELHNRELQRALHELRRAHPGATAVRYADLYGPVAAAVASPKEYGFGSSPLAACCGSGGEPYNFNANFTGFCATPRSTVCADGPSSSVSWDGIHYTEATNKLVARAILTRPRPPAGRRQWTSGLHGACLDNDDGALVGGIKAPSTLISAMPFASSDLPGPSFASWLRPPLPTPVTTFCGSSRTCSGLPIVRTSLWLSLHVLPWRAGLRLRRDHPDGDERDVVAAEGAVGVGPEPGVDARDVEGVAALGQQPEALAVGGTRRGRRSMEALGLPEPTPYLAGKAAAEFRRGANFAVGGATALDPAFLKSRGITSFVPVSLGNETRWFEDVLHLLGGASAHPRTVVVAGMIPIGCEPEMLALFPSDAGDYYDPASGCIARFNRLAELHNRELQRALHELRRAHPGAAAAIVRYADLYGPVAAAIASPGEYGFGSSPLAACCGSGGEPYNFNANFTGFCATPGSTVCADGPSSSVSWDGIHYTEATNKLVARAILTRPTLAEPVTTGSISMTPFSPHLVAAAAALLGLLATAVAGGGTGAYTRVFSFGDSLTDTGNALHLPSTGGGGGPASRPPYGETFFRRPTGRASDGRLAVDFIVEALRLRHPAPYLAAGGETAAEFRHGVNFAVGGSTALPPEFYEGRGLKPFVPVSLANQTAWFDKVLQILGSSDHGRRKIMASSLFIVGEIGVNDYLVSLVGNLTVGEVETSVVPHIVAAIRSTVNEVIAAGATTVVFCVRVT
uniref:GDSL esterase/lipase n=1 Tax=Oryza barthii TaxID=65489 RepID=A0A0D3HD97_9ORYZ